MLGAFTLPTTLPTPTLHLERIPENRLFSLKEAWRRVKMAQGPGTSGHLDRKDRSYGRSALHFHYRGQAVPVGQRSPGRRCPPCAFGERGRAVSGLFSVNGPAVLPLRVLPDSRQRDPAGAQPSLPGPARMPGGAAHPADPGGGASARAG